MKKSEAIRAKSSVKLMQERYEYWEKVPYPGLIVNNRPCCTNMDVTEVGDYVVYLVRDPCAGYGVNPAKEFAGLLEDAKCIGDSGMFLSYTGYYKGAKVTCICGGSGNPEVELAMNDVIE